MRTAAWSFLGVGLVVALASAQEGSTPAPPLPLVLSRAATYVETFADTLSGLVAAESYVQDVHPAFNRFGTMPRFAKPYSGAMHRELKSDLLLVRPVGSEGWMQFRDVTEVDGKKLKDRNDRLARLFLDPSKSTASQSRKIMDESSRYNIGDVERNINLPVLALVVLDRGMQRGFQFAFEKADEKVDIPKSAAFQVPDDALVVTFHETQSRTMVISPQGKSLPASGRFWLDRATSRVFMTEIGIDDLWLKADIFVAYGSVDTIKLPVPVEMHEQYENKLNGSKVDGTATYTNFREFKVNVDEDIAPIDDKGKQDR
ncbi:MAG: hypothetical protein U0Q11_01155 [Vicinamibacterales bacterium]